MKNILLLIIGALVIAGASFVGGVYYAGQGGTSLVAQNAANPTGNQLATGNASTSGAQPSTSARSFFGRVTAKSPTGITLALDDGSTVTAFITSATPIQQMTSKKLSDIATGSKVTVIGRTSNDGSITAQTIILLPSVGTTTPATQTPVH